MSAFATNWPSEISDLKLDRASWMYLAISNDTTHLHINNLQIWPQIV